MISSQQEVAERLAGLNKGPWTSRGELAWKEIAPTSIIGRVGTARDLKKLFRPHWEAPIFKAEGFVRDSFDEALTKYQLFELAVEAGYLKMHDIVDSVRSDFKQLFATEPAQKYLRDYDYFAIGFLAQRAQVDIGWPVLELPQVSVNDSTRFAVFLSQHHLWYDDGPVEAWTGFLDDYQTLNDKSGQTDKKVFKEFLATARPFDDERALLNLFFGADRFLLLLSDIFKNASIDERLQYGLFYAYWMARMFGHKRGAGGFYLDSSRTDWATDLLKSKRLRELVHEEPAAAGSKPVRTAVLPDAYFAELGNRIDIVRKAWTETLSYLKRLTGSGTSNGGVAR